MRCALLLVAATAFTASLSAQSPAAPVYVEQFFNLAEKAGRMYSEISAAAQPFSKSPKDRVALWGRLLALRKLTYQLGESAAQENVNAMEKGHSVDKKLLLVRGGCDAIAFLLGALDDYVSTDDRAFLGFAVDGWRLTESVKKCL